MSCTKNPPKLEDESEYEMWRKNIEVWVELTELPKEKQALAVHMSLKGRAQAASSQISITDMKKATGVKEILDKLDQLYLSETGRRQFFCFRSLYRMKRESTESIDMFISKFEHQQFKLNSLGVQLPDTVLAFLLIESCGLEGREEQLILSSMTDVKYDAVKASLKRVFGSNVDSSDCKSVPIKQEPIFLGECSQVGEDHGTMFTRGRGRGTYRGAGNWRSRGNLSRGSNSGFQPRYPTKGGRKTNPTNYKGEVQKCHICNSIFHFARDCPDACEEEKSFKGNDDFYNKHEKEVVHLSLFVGFSNNEDTKSSRLSKLVEDSSCAAIIDCGASSSVCGKPWLEDYLQNLTEFDKSCIEERESDTVFTFGDGVSYQSEKCVIIPCYVGKTKANIAVDVVECNVPLLLSKKALKKGQMVVDFGKDTLRVGDQLIKLEETSSGHYKLPLKF